VFITGGPGLRHISVGVAGDEGVESVKDVLDGEGICISGSVWRVWNGREAMLKGLGVEEKCGGGE